MATKPTGKTASPLARVMRSSFAELMKGINTCLPGYFLSFDPDTQLAQVQIALQLIDSEGVGFNPPPLVEVPVYFPSGGAFTLEFQINQGAEGIVIFSQRCIDAWIDQGGISPQAIRRQFDASDAFFLPGMNSQPNKMTGFSNDGIRLRNEDGSKSIWLKSSGDVEINAGNCDINSATLKHNNVNIGATHTHTGSPTAPVGAISPTGTPTP